LLAEIVPNFWLCAQIIVGIVPYTSINIDAPISSAFAAIGLGWCAVSFAVLPVLL
jgi:hypothetical protein